MSLIKKIIDWFKRLFKKIFGKTNKTKYSNKSNKNDKQLVKKTGNINVSSDDTMPSYMIIGDKRKEKLLYGLSIMVNFLSENNNKLKEKESIELLKLIKNNKIDSILIENIEKNEEFDKLLNYDFIKSIIKGLEEKNKKEIIDQYEVITKREKEFKIHLDEVEKICQMIKKNNISIPTENAIEEEIDTITSDKNPIENIIDKVDNFSKNIYLILGNNDDEIIGEVLKEYKKVNFVTLSNVIIDNYYDRFTKLEEDFKNHRFNRYYYEREINKIKRELNKIKDLKNNKEVNDHINNIRKELYTKSKDKYDLLYNNEVFMNFEKECDDLLNRVNTKVVDIKKEVKEEKDDKKKEEDKYLEKILQRFHDMRLARLLILKAQEEDIEYQDNVDEFIYNLYRRFNDNMENSFNFERNKCKTEFVILYNGLSKVVDNYKKETFIPIEHINFRMEDLVEAVKVRKSEVDTIIKKPIVIEEGKIVDEKIDSLIQNNYHYTLEKPVVLKKELKNNNHKNTAD